MKITAEQAIAEIMPLYLQNPCRISAIAFWKVKQQISKAEFYKLENGSDICLYAINDNKLLFYWANDFSKFYIPENEFSTLSFWVMHDDYYQTLKKPLDEFNTTECYPLLYDFSHSLKQISSTEYYIANFNFNDKQEFSDAAELINSAYKGHNHKSAEVISWSKLPAFDPTMWIWVKAKGSNEPVALGISTYQESIRETYLDWIQVSPKHHGKGIGKLLVYETLAWALPKSDIIRVTGIADEFYKSCGFRETDKWIYGAKKKNS